MVLGIERFEVFQLPSVTLKISTTLLPKVSIVPPQSLKLTKQKKYLQKARRLLLWLLPS
jgi:hypothetical protein